VAAAPCEPQQTDMPAARQVLDLRAQRTIKKTGAQASHQRLYISSIPASQADALMLGAYTRGHWGIENRNHWRRDACWGEDTRCRTRNPNAACALALLRSALLLPALTAKTKGLPDLAERCQASNRFALSLLNRRSFQW
jgi:predicted transposase YbfD/YdcC